MDIGYKNENAWKTENKETVFAFAEDYKKFLDNAYTEREAVKEVIRLAKEQGFCDIESKNSLVAGDKVYKVNRGKGIILAVIGSMPISKGFNMVGAHIDSPRLDVKPNPIIEDGNQALMKTHYYGGIKKYQWTTIPLALSGVVIKKDGTKIEVSLGKEGDDFCFTITDLLIHLASDQMKKTLAEGVLGEDLNVLIGGIPEFSGDKESVKKAVLLLLKERYNILEEELLTAELSFVPAFRAKDIGFDRSFIGAYGHDDRVCAYPALRAIFEIKNPKKTAVCLLCDKEEVGSMGVTGMQSRFFENTIADMIDMSDEYSDLSLRHALSGATCLSADVTGAFDPNYPAPFEKQNSALCGCGIALEKYTGARGKGGSSDASAELFSSIARIMDRNGVSWQTGELGKVDIGGGGTIAQFAANLDIDTIDAGVPVLSMHAPFEVISKVDLYSTFKAYTAFMKEN